jgi:hypothetical protein
MYPSNILLVIWQVRNKFGLPHELMVKIAQTISRSKSETGHFYINHTFSQLRLSKSNLLLLDIWGVNNALLKAFHIPKKYSYHASQLTEFSWIKESEVLVERKSPQKNVNF